MVQVYIKYTDNNYYLLDLDPNENINYKITAKDLNDINKIFSPFTQSFKLDATDKNKRLCGFYGNEKLQRLNNTNEFDALLYVGGFLFQSGKLTFDETDYNFKNQNSFKTNFASNLTSLVQKLGDSTIQDLFIDDEGGFDREVKINWGVANEFTQKKMRGITTTTMKNDVLLKYGIPFMSNKRVWTFDQVNLATPNNIAFNPRRVGNNCINVGEVRPAVGFMTIMNLLTLKIGSPIICPSFDTQELKELYVWCNSENIVPKSDVSFFVKPYSAMVKVRENVLSTPPTLPKWILSETDGIFKVERNEAVSFPNSWSDGFDVTVLFNGLVSLESTETKMKVSIIRNVDNYVLDSQEITSNKYTFRIIDKSLTETQLDVNGELYFRVEILPLNLVRWTSITAETKQFYRFLAQVRADYRSTSINSTDSTLFGGNKFNLATTLPTMKCTDFLKSFFKMFNISVISTGKNDQSMFWLTPENIKEINKEYSKRIVDYTPYVNIASINKKKANDFNFYHFKHKESKYYESVYGNGKIFGELKYPEVAPAKSNKFEVATDFSILKQASTFSHPTGIRTCLAFEKDSPTLLDDDTLEYKPVYEEPTLLYMFPKSLGEANSTSGVSFEFSDTTNKNLTAILEPHFVCSNGKTLAFGGEDVYTNGLYLNHYKDFIELLLKPNTFKSDFVLELPPNEIFLNFSNTNQNEGNIPTGFRPQNEIIISKQRYQLADATIELTSGKTKLTLLNF